MSRELFVPLVLASLLMFGGCNNRSSHNEFYSFLETNKKEMLFNCPYGKCINLLGHPDTVMISPFDYYRPHDICADGHPETNCEGVFAEEISCLKEHIPGFVYMSAIWHLSNQSTQEHLTISFLPKGNEMVSFYVKYYD